MIILFYYYLASYTRRRLSVESACVSLFLIVFRHTFSPRSVLFCQPLEQFTYSYFYRVYRMGSPRPPPSNHLPHPFFLPSSSSSSSFSLLLFLLLSLSLSLYMFMPLSVSLVCLSVYTPSLSLLFFSLLFSPAHHDNGLRNVLLLFLTASPRGSAGVDVDTFTLNFPVRPLRVWSIYQGRHLCITSRKGLSRPSESYVL